ncbi:MAG: DUF3574 domain-containing protein [Desulfovibrionales bacterium]|nr:DUF3574 domain-containing protein [Desulfovibrionales bacterium]
MKKFIFALTLLLVLPLNGFSQEVYSLKLFFGMSRPEGGGISMRQWQNFEQNTLAKTFEGFTVSDAIGYYKGLPERSKVVTLIIQEKEMEKVRLLARKFARSFNQESVMVVTQGVKSWEFIGQN